MNILPSYDNFSDIEQAEFRAALQKLLYEGSLQWIVEADRPAYELLEQYRAEVTDVLHLFDTHLEVNDNESVMYFEPIEGSKGLIKIRSRDQLALLMLLRVEFERQRQQKSTPIRMRLDELSRGYEGAIRKPIPPTRFKETLKYLKKLKLVSFSNRELDHWDSTILILPLVLILTKSDIDEMAAAIEANSSDDTG
jgi:hypothetical protein